MPNLTYTWNNILERGEDNIRSGHSHDKITRLKKECSVCQKRWRVATRHPGESRGPHIVLSKAWSQSFLDSGFRRNDGIWRRAIGQNIWQLVCS